MEIKFQHGAPIQMITIYYGIDTTSGERVDYDAELHGTDQQINLNKSSKE